MVSDSDNSRSSIGSDTETIKHSSSSIIGLRSAAFDKSKSEETDESGPKPRPPPKPRPWSIVGVDRKSGEYTQVESAVSSPPHENAPEVRGAGASGGGKGKEDSEKTSQQSQQQAAAPQPGQHGLASKHRGSVRDMIASLNKPDAPGATAAAAAGPAASVRDRIASMNKGNSSSSSDQDSKKKLNPIPGARSSGIDPMAKSPSTRPKHSPINRKKDSTSDDPRILKLDDDFLYDDPVNV